MVKMYARCKTRDTTDDMISVVHLSSAAARSLIGTGFCLSSLKERKGSSPSCCNWRSSVESTQVATGITARKRIAASRLGRVSVALLG